jgi:uncharacterized protein (TIGR02246 family)
MVPLRPVPCSGRRRPSALPIRVALALGLAAAIAAGAPLASGATSAAALSAPGSPAANPAPAEASAPEAEGPHAGIRALLEEQAAAWTRGDLEAFCAGYAEDATFVSPGGLTQGRAEVLARYRKRYPDRAAMGALALELLEVRAAPGAGAPRSVSAVARWTLSGTERETAAGLTLLVFHREPGGPWRIVQDASM